MSDTPEEGITERVAAILAADAVGYSRLMADDEAATVKALDQARDVFRRHINANSGRVVDTAGDSVLAVFETTSGAVRASVAIQEGLQALNADTPSERQMQFRIGIHLGDIMEKASDGTIYGDGVNVAARLEALSEPGGIIVSGSVHESIRDRVDVGFAFLGEHEGKNLKTPVKAYRVLPEGEEPETPKVKPKIPLKGVIAAAIAAIVVVAGVVWWQMQEPEPVQMVDAQGVPTDDPVLAMPTGPTIAVLPFDNMSGNPEDEYFADGLAEDILTRLSLFDGLTVIARTSSFEFKDQDIDVREIGKRLGARYVLEGSVRRGGEAVRITAQLLDSRNGGHLWGKSYDRPLDVGEIFAVQDEITNEIAAALGDVAGIIVAEEYENIRHKAPSSLEAYDCVLLAKNYRLFNFDNFAAVSDCLRAVVERDPDYVDAWAWLAQIYLDDFALNRERPEVSDPLDSAIVSARRALDLDLTNQQALKVLALSEFWLNDAHGYLDAAKRAIAINPNSAEILAEIGIYSFHAAHYDWGVALLEKAIAMTPNPPEYWYQVLSLQQYRLHDYQTARDLAQRSLAPWFYYGYFALTIAEAQLGNLSEARSAAETLIEISPGFAKREGALADLQRWSWAHDPSVVEHWMEGLEKSGLFDEPEAPSRPVIAVLPFDNLSGDPEQDYFADGITEDIITRLAQYPDILVLGRNTTFQFKGQAVDIPTIAEKLGADYVVEGSIRRGGDTVRVTAQLLGGDEWAHIWAETYDRTLDPANLFAMQDEITEAMASRIGDAHGVIGRAELQRSSRHAPKRLSSYECILRFFEFERHFNAENHLVARDCLESVVKAEPDYGEALAFLGNTYFFEVTFGFNASEESSLERALEFLERGVAIDPGSGRARIHLAQALYVTDNAKRAIREAEEALRIDPNNAAVIAYAGQVFVNTGEYEHTEEVMAEVALTDPNYPAWVNWNMAKVHLARGEYADAIIRLEMTKMAWWYWTKVMMAAAYCASADIERGKDELSAALETNPDLVKVYWPDIYFWNKRPNVRPMIDNLSAGLEACGWDVPPDPGREAFAN